MTEGKPRSTDPPKCKTCGVAHRGTCVDHEARGAISSQITAPLPKVKMIEGRVRKPTVLQIVNAAVESLPALNAKDVTPRLDRAKAALAAAEARPPKKRGPKPGKVPFDKKKYQAKLMRDRRAAAKKAASTD